MCELSLLKSLSTVLITLALLSSISAQQTYSDKKPQLSYGPQIGGASTNIVFGDSPSSLAQWEPTFSAIIGGVVELKLSKRFALQGELSHISIGSTTKPIADLTWKYRIIEAPLMIKVSGLNFNFLPSWISSDYFDLGLMGGLSYHYAYSGIARTENEKGKIDFKEANLKRATLGLPLYATAELVGNKGQKFTLKVGTNIGITDFDKAEDFKRFLGSYSISIGFMLPHKMKIKNIKHIE